MLQERAAGTRSHLSRPPGETAGSVRIRDWDAKDDAHSHAPRAETPRVGDSPEDWAIFDLLVRQSTQEQQEEKERETHSTKKDWNDSVHLLVSHT